jgi:type II secretory pathway pseudopilin PulG
MTRLRLRSWPGLSLIELILFLALTGVVSVVVLLSLLSAQEGNARQQAVLDIERTGSALLETFTYQVRNSERIIDPPRGGTGHVLALQTGTPETDPTLFGQEGSGIVLIERDTAYDLIQAGTVTVTSLIVTNTSPDDAHPSVQLTVTLSRRPAVPSADPYVRTFVTTVAGFPTDAPQGGACGCSAPTCFAATDYRWEACDLGICYPLSEPFNCP